MDRSIIIPKSNFPGRCSFQRVISQNTSSKENFKSERFDIPIGHCSESLFFPHSERSILRLNRSLSRKFITPGIVPKGLHSLFFFFGETTPWMKNVSEKWSVVIETFRSITFGNNNLLKVNSVRSITSSDDRFWKNDPLD